MAQAILAQAGGALLARPFPGLVARAPAAMKRLRSPLVCLALLLAGGVHGSRISHPRKPADNLACKSTCQRFGMKLLAKFWSDFRGVANPTACCDVCDKVLPASSALLQGAGSPPVAVPATAAQPQKAGGASGVPPVKR
uniref:Uncharacterized protein n=1 Tax=Alexandrium monilatum TaxID=311494 RepID=A0A6T1GF39_9DINO